MKDSTKEEFEQLIQKCTTRVLSIAMGVLQDQEDAKDICQEVFLQLFEATQIVNKEAWLYRVTINRAINMRNQNFSRRTREEQISQNESFCQDSLHSLTKQEEKQHLQEAITTLPERQQEIFLLRHQGELPLKEIASLLKISEGSVKKQLSRSLETLRKKLIKRGAK